jgi:16S rRNA (guanine966-N2)-methyltransferase
MLIMTRIIAGVAGSLKLTSPAKSTRPTSDRIRESIFSKLEARDLLEGATVLDLYAGTGALALEAASRGANLAWMVERDGKAAAVCVANLKIVSKALLKEEIGFDGKVINKSVSAFLNAPGIENVNLVFIDPPYEVSNEEIQEDLEKLKPLLSKSTVVVERSSRTDAPTWPNGYTLEDTKSYGDTVVYWLSA